MRKFKSKYLAFFSKLNKPMNDVHPQVVVVLFRTVSTGQIDHPIEYRSVANVAQSVHVKPLLTK